MASIKVEAVLSAYHVRRKLQTVQEAIDGLEDPTPAPKANRASEMRTTHSRGIGTEAQR